MYGYTTEMKYGIFSDIHGNLEALQAVMSRMDELGVQRRVCLGDVVGYDPQTPRMRGARPLARRHLHPREPRLRGLGWEASESFNFYARRAIGMDPGRAFSPNTTMKQLIKSATVYSAELPATEHLEQHLQEKKRLR